MEGKIAVLGNSDFVMPFSAMGLDTFAVADSPQGVADTAAEIVKAKYALVVVAENVVHMASDALDRTNKKATPCVVVVPFTTESTGFATKSLGSLLKAATGINIFANN